MTVETMNEGRAEPQPWRAFIGDFAWQTVLLTTARRASISFQD